MIHVKQQDQTAERSLSRSCKHEKSLGDELELTEFCAKIGQLTVERDLQEVPWYQAGRGSLVQAMEAALLEHKLLLIHTFLGQHPRQVGLTREIIRPSLGFPWRPTDNSGGDGTATVE